MSKENGKLTRRGFMMRSAFAIGAAHGCLLTESANADVIDCNPKLTGNIVDYPWDVGVDCAARATLYLVMGRTIGSLIYRSLAETFQHMHDRADAAAKPDSDKLVYAINDKNKKYTIGDLKTQLLNAKAACTASKTYAHHARTLLSLSLAKELIDLEKMIAVPLIHTDYNYINGFLTAGRERDIKWHGNPQSGSSYQGRCMEHLFLTPRSGLLHAKHSDPQSEAEVPLWHDVRDSGLLWCAPRKKPMNSQIDVTITPNGFTCVDGRCSDQKKALDYCQEVDGSCNGMATTP